MFSSKSMAFTSFLDLISCAFGSAILIFVVSATTGQSSARSRSADILLIRCRLYEGELSEAHFSIKEPSGRSFRTTGNLPLGYSHFVSTTGENAMSFLIIPRPSAGKWTIQPYWANESIASGASSRVRMEVMCPRSRQGEHIVKALDFSSTVHLTDPVIVDIGE